MNQQEILNKIGGIIAELKDQYSYLEVSGNGLNDLELELFMANANFLADHIGILKKLNVQATPAMLQAPTLVLQLKNTYPEKPQIFDYLNEQEHLLYAEDPLNIKKDLIEATEQTLEEVPAAANQQQEIIILPEAMPQNAANELLTEDASFTTQKYAPEGNEGFLPLEAMPQNAAEELLPEDASFTAQKYEPESKEVFLPLEVKPEAMPQNAAEELLPKDASFTAQKYEPESKEVFLPLEVKPEITVPVQSEKIISPEEEQSEAIFNIPETPPQFVEPKILKSEPEPVLTLNQQIAAQKGLDQPKETISGSVNKTVPDLPSIINLNDKLLFVKELFNGYNLAYSEAINILNRYTTFEQAQNFLNVNYVAKNNWKEKPATAERFYDLLRKRFG